MRFMNVRLLLCLIICPFFSLGQEGLDISKNQFAFQVLDVDKGLSQNSVVSIAQDSTGFLWFATQEGLNRYDGRGFNYYNKQFEDVTRSTYSRLGKIYAGSDNSFWIVTLSGKLEKYNSKIDVWRCCRLGSNM